MSTGQEDGGNADVWTMTGVDNRAMLLRRVAGELCRIEHRSGWQRVLDIQEALQPLREPDGTYGQSLRQLASHADCPLSKSQLYDALEAARLFHLEPVLQASAFLSPSHAAVVARVPSGERGALLVEAEVQKMSVRDFVQHVRALRKGQGERRGRPQTTAADKAITRYDNAVLCLEEAFELLSEGPISVDEREHLSRLGVSDQRWFGEGDRGWFGQSDPVWFGQADRGPPLDG